ncbi:MAG TPA: pitrilysin family protein, partial [Saprospiraceae bacterium]|nr:pitrilysin family protein [Saprospiraceae bacterium]
EYQLAGFFFSTKYLPLMLDRSTPPPIADISQLQLPPYRLIRLSNGIPLYVVDMGTQDVVKLEVIFHAGRPFEHKKLVARATLSQLKEGTLHRDGAELAELLDFYGATLQTPYSLDSSNIALYSLNKHFDKVLPLLSEMLECPVFPQKELESFIQRNQVDLQIELTKPDVVAYRHITELIFGDAHPYGYNSYPETYSALSREDMIRHFQEHFTAGNCSIFLSGKIQPGMTEMVDSHLGRVIPAGTSQPHLPPLPDVPPQRIHLPHPDKVQSAIRIGRRLFNRNHPDYAGLYVLNTILGGYFGSRLMTNIREEKGYTYNIYSSLDPMRYDGAFFIGTETGTEFVKDTITQIYNEIEILQQELVDDEEMEMVRNYLLGGFLNMLDGPFNVADIIKTVVVEDLPEDYFQTVVHTVKTITPEDLQQLAQRYLRPEDLWEVSVGSGQ